MSIQEEMSSEWGGSYLPALLSKEDEMAKKVRTEREHDYSAL